jgi:spermidine/putrescine transport system ATP-binding protein
VPKHRHPSPLSGQSGVAPIQANSPSAIASVEIQALAKSFGTVAALSGVTLQVEHGEFVSFLGPSGCGKTTLLRIIAGLEAPTSGDVRIAGRSVVREPPYRRNIGLVFQSYALFPHKSVAANVDFGLRHRTGLSARERAAAIDQALALVRLERFRDRKPSELSGGQQQRVALARAVVTRPEVLLLDEPLSNLDAKLREEMRIELKDLHRTLGMTFIYVTHDRTEALSMSDRIVVMRDGRVDQIGTPQQVFEEPDSIEVARFMGHSNLLRGEVVTSDNGTVRVEIEREGIVAASARHWRHDSSRVWLLIRNNAIALRPAAGGSRDGVLRARVRSIFYHGLHVEAHVDLSSGAVLRVELPAHENRQLERGADVDAEIVSAGTWILQREE